MASEDDTQLPRSIGTAQTVAADGISDGVVDLPRPNPVQFGQRYEPGELLGKGGMGEVRELADQRIGRRVAMKVIRSGQGTQGSERFLREARVQGQLEHPSIVPVYDLGLDPQGAPYFTMKSLRGSNLAVIIKSLARGEEEATERYGRARLLGIFVDVCQAIAFAHQKGVVHRDIKPANVMVGDFGEVYVLDWGVAKLGGEADESTAVDPEALVRDTDQTPQTEAGAILGTPGYMAPEQFSGQRVDSRADVYALGVLLFELLFLERMHRGNTATALMVSTLEGIDWQQRIDACDIDPPPELVAVCRKATAKEAGDRHAGARELLAQIERFLEGDRDIALRKQLADNHVERATELLESDRAAALQELGRALALRPEHQKAGALLRHVFLDVPSEPPPEVREELSRADAEASRKHARQAGFTYISWLVFAILPIWMGLRDTGVLAAIVALVVVESVLAFSYARAERPNHNVLLASAVLNMVLLGIMTRFFGPFVLTPVLAAAATLSFVLHPIERGRLLIVFSGACAILVPWGLEQLGVLAPSYAFTGDQVRILGNATDFAPLPTELMLLTTSVGAVVISGFVVSKIRGVLRETQKKLQMQTWQLRQLVPAETANVE